MKALLYPAFDRMEMAERPRPTPAPGEVLLRVAACGICGSELEAFKNRSPRRPPPLVMGHEFCGVVEEIGPDVEGYAPGRKVVSNALIGCGDCARCRRGDTHLCASRQLFGMHRAGGFAEFVAVPTQALLPWPDTLPAQAAALTEPLANGVHMVHLTERLRPETVLVIGAGPIGLMAQQAFQTLAGAAAFVADLSAERRRVAERLGAQRVFNPRDADLVSSMREITGGEGVDLVIDAVGAGVTKQQSVAAARAGGAAVWIGLHENAISLDSYEVTLPEKQVLGTYAARQRDMAEALDLMAAGKVDVTSWSQTFPLEDGVEAFTRMLRAEGNDIKAVLIPA